MDRTTDAKKVATAFHEKAAEYDLHVLVQKRVVAQLIKSVSMHLEREPQQILDVGTGTGALLECFKAKYPYATLAGVDIAHNMCLRAQQKLGPGCHIVNGDAECLPFSAASFDLVISASMLQWVNNLSVALYEMRRVAKPGGNISLAFFCDGTLEEMQHCFRSAAEKYSGNSSQITSRLHDFWSVDDLKSIVRSMDFERAVISVETEVDWYDDLHSLLRSIKSIGAGSVSGSSSRGLGWRGILLEASRIYQANYGANGRIPATYKVVYLSAKVP